MRKLHRWISPFAALFLLSVAVTGTVLQFQKLLGGEEAEKEKLAAATSAYTLTTSLVDLPAALTRAQAAVRGKLGEDAPLDGVDVRLKGEHLSLVLHTAGKERWNFTVNAATGQVEAQSKDEGESFIRRLHSGEVFGDAGVVLGILWGLALVVLTVTGVVLYWQMWRTRRRARGATAANAALVVALAALSFGNARADLPFFFGRVLAAKASAGILRFPGQWAVARLRGVRRSG